ncbi:MAG TPA: winged helix-turn-helix domain-containing protein, partial [Acidimicrobiaceae bacterium]|nr:winged helix-turn-helix domain-containing protein [Acidimicrobiaceae bacterium]
AWSRLGSAYQPAHMRQALEHDRTLFEHRAQPVETEPAIVMIRPMADLGLHL